MKKSFEKLLLVLLISCWAVPLQTAVRENQSIIVSEQVEEESSELTGFFCDEFDGEREIVRPEIKKRTRFQEISLQVGIQAYLIGDSVYKNLRSAWWYCKSLFGYEVPSNQITVIAIDPVKQEGEIRNFFDDDIGE